MIFPAIVSNNKAAYLLVASLVLFNKNSRMLATIIKPQLMNDKWCVKEAFKNK